MCVLQREMSDQLDVNTFSSLLLLYVEKNTDGNQASCGIGDTVCAAGSVSGVKGLVDCV